MSTKNQEEIEFILNRLYFSYGIEGYYFDECKGLQLQCNCGDEAVVSMAIDLFRSSELSQKDNAAPFIYTVMDDILSFSFTDEKGACFLFGPVAGALTTEAQRRQYCHECHIRKQNYHIPGMTFMKILGIASMSCYMLTGNMFTEEEIQEKNSLNQMVSKKDQVSYQLYRLEEEKKRTSYDQEVAWIQLIEDGVLHEKMADLFSSGAALEKVGTMSRASDLKQIEYTAVTAITLATRAAIRGGVESSECYETSDLFLQKLSATKNKMDYMEISRQAMNTFSQLVWKKKHEQRQEGLVEQCKNYIASHLYHDFTIQQMADELAVNRSYLSTRFSESSGMTLYGYLVDERLKAAANLLKYSDSPVGQIAEYMHFSSSSRFSCYFKKKYGMTPLHYREQNRSPEF